MMFGIYNKTWWRHLWQDMMSIYTRHGGDAYEKTWWQHLRQDMMSIYTNQSGDNYDKTWLRYVQQDMVATLFAVIRVIIIL